MYEHYVFSYFLVFLSYLKSLSYKETKKHKNVNIVKVFRKDFFLSKTTYTWGDMIFGMYNHVSSQMKEYTFISEYFNEYICTEL